MRYVSSELGCRISGQSHLALFGDRMRNSSQLYHSHYGSGIVGIMGPIPLTCFGFKSMMEPAISTCTCW